MEPEVLIKCQGAGEVSLDELNLLHHFKTLEQNDYARGRNVLLERGFKFPFTVWIDSVDSAKYTLDGNQRLTILKRMRDEGGIKLPDRFPCNYITAESKKDAAKDIIASETKFADINPTEFTDFLAENEIDWADVDSWADIPDLGVEDPIEGKSDGGSKKEFEIKCPACGHMFKPERENSTV